MTHLKRHIAVTAVALALFGCAGTTTYLQTVNATAGVFVRLMRGMGPSAWSYGVDDIGQRAAKIPNVAYVSVSDYTQDQQIADAVDADPPGAVEIVGGYSCGANASTVIGTAVKRNLYIVVIQPSDWCGGTYLTPNVLRAQETYNPMFAETAGLGAYQLQPGPGFPASRLTLVDRPDCHLCADTDPDAQNDVLDFISSVASPAAGHRMAAALGPRPKAGAVTITRRAGQRVY